MGTPRIRSGTYRYRYSALSFSTDTSPGSWYNQYYTYPWSQSGYDNHDWQARIEAGLDASSVYTTSGAKLKVFSRRYLQGTYNQTVGGKVYVRNAWHFDSGRPAFSSPTFTSVNARNKAIGRFYRKLQDVYQAFDGLTFIGELFQIRRSIAERAGNLVAKMTKDHKRMHRYAKRARKRQERQKLYSDSYLEATFGWMPFFSDISDLASAFDHEVQPIVRIAASEFEEGAPVLTKLASGTGIFTWDVITRKVHDVKYSFVAGVRPDWEKPDAFGFDLKNLPLAAWELTPWSFVVDYFVDVQGWLTSKIYSSISPVYSVEGVLQTHKVRVSEYLDHRRGADARNFQAGTCLDNLSTTYRFNRYLLGSLPQMKGPTIRGVPSAKQLLNLVALYSARSDYSNL